MVLRRTKTQKNFHKEMKKYYRKNKKNEEILSYIYKDINDYDPGPGIFIVIVGYACNFIYLLFRGFIILVTMIYLLKMWTS